LMSADHQIIARRPAFWASLEYVFVMEILFFFYTVQTG
jgi:hypothetical protein